jgi:Carboxypeptidase regulatory-like domain
MADVRLLFLLVLPVSLVAQTAQLSGFVRDSRGNAIPHASVEVRNVGTGGVSRAKSNREGIYLLSTLNPGKYDLTAQAAGFKTLTRDGIRLEVGQRAQLDLTLQLGTAAQTVPREERR